MTWFVHESNAWSETSGPVDQGLSVQIEAQEEGKRPRIRTLHDGAESLHLSGADPRPDTDTTHTVARIGPDGAAKLLFAVHAQDSDLIFEDLRPEGDDEFDRAFDQVQSSLNEILIPVYIDDVIGDLSENLSGLVLLHTAQYASSSASSWTYFRAAGFDGGDLVIEVEHGEL